MDALRKFSWLIDFVFVYILAINLLDFVLPPSWLSVSGALLYAGFVAFPPGLFRKLRCWIEKEGK
ncbi:MAG: hypothetical protein L6Q60_14165 [Rhodocyclaceae bacterium]|nr:hypothetical protein [Rhodocyclaceae bacterium]